MAFFRMFPDGGAAERALQSAELKRFVKQGVVPGVLNGWCASSSRMSELYKRKTAAA